MHEDHGRMIHGKVRQRSRPRAGAIKFPTCSDQRCRGSRYGNIDRKLRSSPLKPQSDYPAQTCKRQQSEHRQ